MVGFLCFPAQRFPFGFIFLPALVAAAELGTSMQIRPLVGLHDVFMPGVDLFDKTPQNTESVSFSALQMLDMKLYE